MEKHIYFVRHGESEYNRDRIYRGDDAALTDSGRTQAELVAERVVKLGVTRLFSSPLPRAQDTSAAISEKTGLAPETIDLLREWKEPTSFYGKHITHPEVVSANAAIRDASDPEYRHLDEETFAELSMRAKAALDFLESCSDERICAVTHVSFLTMIVGHILFGEKIDPWMTSAMFNKLRHRNTGITYIKHAVFKSEEPIWQLVTWNDQTHLG